MRDSSVMMIPVEMAQTFPAAAMKNWWEEVNESAQWQDGIFFSLCGAYALVSAIALVKLMWIEISEPEDGWTKQTVFYLLNFVFHGVRAVLFRFHHEVFLEHPKVICWILLDLPVLLFFSAYTLVLLFLAETDQERDLPTDKLREIYIRGNVIVYFLQVNTWSYSWKKDASSVELVEKIFMAVVSFIVALGFLHYGRRLYSQLRGFPTESAERMKKRLEVVSVTAICFSSFLIKGIVVGVSAFDSDLRLDALDRPVQNLIYYMVVEIIPSARVLFILRM